MSIVSVHGPHTWGQPFFAQTDLIAVNRLGPLDLEFKSLVDVAGASDESFDWDFGDGTSVVNGFEVKHLFPAPGQFVVTMTAHTDDGPVTDQITIDLDGHRETVEEPEAEEEDSTSLAA